MIEESEHFEEQGNSNSGNEKINDNKSENENADNQDLNITNKSLLTRIAEKDEGKKYTKLIKKIKTKKVIKNKINYEEDHDSDVSLISEDEYEKKIKLGKKKNKKIIYPKKIRKNY